MKFEINKIIPSMSRQEKIIEYSRRISFYHLMMTKERNLSKIFGCSELKRNAIDNGGIQVGCLKRPDLEPCEACATAAGHYVSYREYNKRKATALRQLNCEMSSENTAYDEYKEVSRLIWDQEYE